MTKINQNGLVRPHRTKIIALIRLFDIAIISFTLLISLSSFQLEFVNSLVWWILIAVTSFEFFAELCLLYTAPRGVKIYVETLRTIIAWLGVMLAFFIILQYKPNIIPEGYGQVYKCWSILVPLLLIAWHFLLRLLINTCRSLGRNTRQVAIIGTTGIGRELEQIFKKDSWLGFSFVGYFDDQANNQIGRVQNESNKVSGSIQRLIQLCKEQKIDIVYVTLPMKDEYRIKEILSELSDTTVTVYYVPDLLVFDLLSSKMDNLSGIPIISVYDTPFYGVDGFSKRLFDLVMASVILILISPLLLIIAIGVKTTSPGTVLFKQHRYGFRGEKISIWKFRSMTVCENGPQIQQARQNDQRLTKFGAFLRRTSLDELPQFFNVLQGRMSIIGPRPHAVAHNELYRGQIKGYMLRHKVRPGITGLAQINGFRGETDTLDKMNGRVQYDLEYIRNWSFALDIRIFFVSLVKGFICKQAY